MRPKILSFTKGANVVVILEIASCHASIGVMNRRALS